MFPLGDKVKALKVERDRALLERRKFEDAATENLRALEAERGDHARTRATLTDAQRELVEAQNRLIEERNAHSAARAEAQANAFVVGDLQKQLKAVLGHLDAVQAEIDKDQAEEARADVDRVADAVLSSTITLDAATDAPFSAGLICDDSGEVRVRNREMSSDAPDAVGLLRAAREQYLEAGAAALAELREQNGPTSIPAG